MLERIDRSKYEDWEWEQEIKRSRQERLWLKKQEEEKWERLKKLEKKVPVWITVIVFGGLPMLSFFHKFSVLGYVSFLLTFTFEIPVLPVIWLGALLLAACYFVMKEKK